MLSVKFCLQIYNYFTIRNKFKLIFYTYRLVKFAHFNNYNNIMLINVRICHLHTQQALICLKKTKRLKTLYIILYCVFNLIIYQSENWSDYTILTYRITR